MAKVIFESSFGNVEEGVLDGYKDQRTNLPILILEGFEQTTEKKGKSIKFVSTGVKSISSVLVLPNKKALGMPYTKSVKEKLNGTLVGGTFTHNRREFVRLSEIELEVMCKDLVLIAHNREINWTLLEEKYREEE